MPYYRDLEGRLHYLDSDRFESLLPEGSVHITDAEAQEIIDDAEAAKPPVYPHFVGNQKLDLFTQAEQLAVVTAAMTDPVVKLMYDRLLGAAYLTWEDAETEYGLQLLLDKGLITQDRKVAIVAAMQP